MSGILERLNKQLNLEGGWKLSPELFGEVACDINDFMIANYRYFLDHVQTLADLIRGLKELDPLADDALAVAEEMNVRDFRVFRISLALERRCATEGDGVGHGSIPTKFRPLVIPGRFIQGLMVAEACEVPLGAALIRMIEWEERANFEE